MVEQIHILHAHFREIILTLNGHSGNFNPFTVFPIGAGSRNLAQINFGVKISCKGIAMVAAVAVQNIDGIDLVKIMLQRISGENAGYAGVKAGAQQGHNASLLKFFFIRPLPRIIEVSREALFLAALVIHSAPSRVINILRLIVSSVNIVNLALQASIHDGQILIGQCHIQNSVRLIGFN